MTTQRIYFQVQRHSPTEKMNRDYNMKKIYRLLKSENAEHDIHFLGDCVFLLLLLCTIAAAGLAFVIVEAVK